MKLNPNALINTDYYKGVSGISVMDSNFADLVIATINSVSNMFEMICNRPLKAKTYDYEPMITVNNILVANPDYNEEYTIFDGIQGTEFYFPTYPVNSITKMLINDVEILPATSYSDIDGYHLYNSRGKIDYYGSFYYGYNRNVKIKWNGGYADTSSEMAELKFLCFNMIQTILNTPANPNLQSEKIGNYSYTNYAPSVVKDLQGLNPSVFAGLRRFRKEVI